VTRRTALVASAALAALALAGWAVAGFRTISAGSEYAVADGPLFGGRARVLTPGRHFLPAGLARVHAYPAGEQVADFRASGVDFQSREGARLAFHGRVVYRLDPGAIAKVHETAAGKPLDEALVRPALSRVLERMSQDRDAPAFGTPEFGRKVEELLGVALASDGGSLIALRDVAGAAAGRAAVVTRPARERNLLVIGLDGADWGIARPLIDAGRLPNLARLAREGATAKLRTITPALSPVIWTSIATGKLPTKHGIFDFLATASDGSKVPVTSTLWRARSLWSILGDAGCPVGVTAWWATWPAEQVRGYVATDRIAYQLFKDQLAAASSDPVAEAAGKTWPPELFREIRPLIVQPASITDEDVGKLVDVRALGTPDADDRDRLDELRTVIASTRTYEAIGTEILKRQPRGFHAVYNESTDTAAHIFMSFRPPRRSEVDARRAAAFGRVMDAVYENADRMIGRLLARIGPGWNVVVVSDHGFKHGEDRPATDSRVSKGQAADWHDRFGVLVLWGPDIRRGARIEDASVLDVTPTILALYGLPRGEDMDGRVLEEAIEPAFLAESAPSAIASWESGDRAPSAVVASSQDPEVMAKLRALGYIGGSDDAPAAVPGPEGAAPGGGYQLEGGLAHINRGVSLLAQRDLDGAKTEFEQALAGGSRAPALVNLFAVHFQKRDVPAAKATLADLERLDPAHKALPGLRGALADLEGNRAEAERLLRLALERDPADSQSRTRLGHVLEVQGRLDEALAEYSEAVRKAPSNAEARNYAGNVWRLKGDLVRAERMYGEAIEADPRYPGAYNNLGLMLQQRGELEQAEQLYRKGLRQAPRAPLLHNSLGGVLLLRGKAEEAEQEIRKALEVDPKMAEAYNNLGILNAERSNAKEAVRNFEQAIAADPRSPDGHFNLAKAMVLLGQPERAFQEFAKVVETAPRHVDACIGAGEMAYKLGRDDAAVSYFERAKALEPGIPRLHQRLGDLYLRKGDRKRAAEEWGRSLALSPNQADLRRKLEQLNAGAPR
jgi:tetratricopeptide (TPR) repeat protein/predicted AlkP superfamily phosphohydrolase/phosphomutase